MRMVIRDDVIWANHLAEDDTLFRLVSALAPGETINLSVDGINGGWEKMQTGRNGRPTPGLKPVGAMRAVWTDWQARRGEAVEVEHADRNAAPYLDALSGTLEEWLSAEDEAAYGKLRPL